MDSTSDYYTKWSKSEKDKQTPYDVLYMWNLKYDTNELIYETERVTDIEQTGVAKGEGRGEGWIGKYLPIVNKYLLSTYYVLDAFLESWDANILFIIFDEHNRDAWPYGIDMLVWDDWQ